MVHAGRPLYREHGWSNVGFHKPCAAWACVWPLGRHVACQGASFCEGVLSCDVRLQGALLGRSFFSFHKMGDAVSVTPFYSAPHAQHQVTGSTQTSLTGFALTSRVPQTGSAASLGLGLRGGKSCASTSMHMRAQHVLDDRGPCRKHLAHGDCKHLYRSCHPRGL